MARCRMRRFGQASASISPIGLAVMWLCVLALIALPASPQQGTINPRIPPPPPPEEPPTMPAQQPTAPGPVAPAPRVPDTPPAPPPNLPASVVIPAGTRIAVVLDTPLSTRIARKGQLVTFRTSDSLRVADQLEIPPETGFTGNVIEVKRPGHFAKPGALRVKVDRINLSTGSTREVVARLDSPDMNGQGRLSSDRNRVTDLYNLTMYTLEGTLIGTQIGGGKGAAIGAGAGALAAVLIMMSRRGADLYLEPGMPFLVILDQPVELPGKEVFEAQQDYARTHGLNGSDATENSNSGSSEVRRNPEGAVLDSDRPKLKRRPKTPQP